MNGSGKDRQVALVAVLVAIWVPVAVGEFSAGTRNLGQLVEFLGAGPPPRALVASVGVVANQWVKIAGSTIGVVSSDFPDRVFSVASVATPAGATVAAFLVVLCLAVLAATTGRRDRRLQSACIQPLAAFLIAVLAVTRIPGDIHTYLLPWVAVVGVTSILPLAWFAFVSVADRRWLSGSRNARVYSVAGAVIIAAAFMVAVIARGGWMARAAESRGAEVTSLYDEIFKEDAATTVGEGNRLVKIVTADTWPFAAGVVLQLVKAGIPVTVDSTWTFMFGDWAAAKGQESEAWEFWSHAACEAAAPGDRGKVIATSQTVVVTAKDLTDRTVAYMSGWGVEEPWGRFATANTSVVGVAVFCAGDTLAFDVAAIDALPCPQEITVEYDGKARGPFSISGGNWQWQTIRIPIDPAPGSGSRRRNLVVTFTCAHQWSTGSGDSRTVSAPFRRITTGATTREQDRPAF